MLRACSAGAVSTVLTHLSPFLSGIRALPPSYPLSRLKRVLPRLPVHQRAHRVAHPPVFFFFLKTICNNCNEECVLCNAVLCDGCVRDCAECSDVFCKACENFVVTCEVREPLLSLS